VIFPVNFKTLKKTITFFSLFYIKKLIMALQVNNKYTQMQLETYNKEASEWSETNRDPVVGSYDAHNAFAGYENLFIPLNNCNQKELVGLDFACGPGRNIIKYKDRFAQLDGADISPVNIEKARSQTATHKIKNDLYVTNGVDLEGVPTDKYDFVMSTIALQHICVYDIRKSILTDMYRVLKPGGTLTIQMGFGNHPWSVGYYENFYDAGKTNGHCDVRIENVDDLKKDLTSIGYVGFKYVFGRTGPADVHDLWIYFSAKKKDSIVIS
jgi:SAM-dependent methyltransferase